MPACNLHNAGSHSRAHGGNSELQQELQDLTTWVNEVLSRKGNPGVIINLCRDLGDGVTLISLLQILTQNTVNGTYQQPCNRQQILHNLYCCLDYLETTGVCVRHVSIQDVADGNLAVCLSLIKNLKKTFEKSKASSVTDCTATREGCGSAYNGFPHSHDYRRLQRPHSAMPIPALSRYVNIGNTRDQDSITKSNMPDTNILVEYDIEKGTRVERPKSEMGCDLGVDRDNLRKACNKFYIDEKNLRRPSLPNQVSSAICNTQMGKESQSPNNILEAYHRFSEPDFGCVPQKALIHDSPKDDIHCDAILADEATYPHEHPEGILARGEESIFDVMLSDTGRSSPCSLLNDCDTIYGILKCKRNDPEIKFRSVDVNQNDMSIGSSKLISDLNETDGSILLDVDNTVLTLEHSPRSSRVHIGTPNNIEKLFSDNVTKARRNSVGSSDIHSVRNKLDPKIVRTREMRAICKHLEKLESQVLHLTQSINHLTLQSCSYFHTDPLAHASNEDHSKSLSSIHSRWHNVQQPDTWILNLFNSKKIEKLKWFFGEEPDVLTVFLHKLGLEIYATNFKNERLSANQVHLIDDNLLRFMGIPTGPRWKIMQNLKFLTKDTRGFHL